MTPTTHTITLTRGFVDETGKAHRVVVMRAPLIDDQVKADAKVAIAGAAQLATTSAESASEVLWELYFAAECIVSLGDIRAVTVDHLRPMSRRDARKIIESLIAFEDRLEREARAHAAAQEAGGAEGKGEASSPDAPRSSSGETPSVAP